MLVGGLSSAVAFVIFLAPGALWAWLTEQRQASVRRSQVVEAGLIALASAAFSTPAIVVLGLLTWFLDRDLSSVEAWLEGSSISGEAAVGYVALLLLQLVLALLTTWWVFRTFGDKLLGDLEVQKVSAWTSVFRSAKTDKTWSAAVEVLLDDGSVIRGIVEDYTPDHELADRELILSEPILHEQGGVSLFANRPAPARAVVSGTAIRRIAVRYLTPEDLAGLQPAGADHPAAYREPVPPCS